MKPQVFRVEISRTVYTTVTVTDAKNAEDARGEVILQVDIHDDRLEWRPVNDPRYAVYDEEGRELIDNDGRDVSGRTHPGPRGNDDDVLDATLGPDWREGRGPAGPKGPTGPNGTD